MNRSFVLRHGFQMAGAAAFASVILFTVVTLLSFLSDRALIDQWEGYTASEEQLFRLREDVNRMADIEHRLAAGGIHVESDMPRAGSELAKVPVLEDLVRRRMGLLREARGHLMAGRQRQVDRILRGGELAQISRDLRQAVFDYEKNERDRIQEQVTERVRLQGRLLDFDIAAIFLAFVLLISSGALVVFYVQRLRRFDRDLVTARLEAERASRLKSSFLANMSHEIRTPLNGVLGLTRLMRETRLNHDQEELVSSLEASGRTLLALVNDILDLSKIESGKIEVVKEAFDLKTLLNDLDKAFRSTAERKKIDFAVENSTIPLGLNGDVTKIRQVLQNLISNAIKFTKDGEVRVVFRRSGDNIRFEVKDTGVGIPEEALSRIFHPFEQADTSTSRVHGGTGLGLAICRHLVRAMGGQMGVQSMKGAGSTFWFEIPFEPAQPPATAAPVFIPAAPAPGAEGPRRILLVEDNEVNARLVVSFLRRRGFDLEVAEDGEKGLQMAASGKYDLVLMDIHLPKKDGLETSRDIRAGRAGAAIQRVPIVALTASAVKGERERCMDAGMNDFLTKPIDLDLLEQTIRRFTGAPAVPLPPLGASAGPRRAPDLDEDLRDELMGLFRKVTPPRLQQLREAVEKQDWKNAGKIAHTMKSSAAQLGFDRLADLCKKLEAKGFGGDPRGWGDEIVALEQACSDAMK